MTNNIYIYICIYIWFWYESIFIFNFLSFYSLQKLFEAMQIKILQFLSLSSHTIKFCGSNRWSNRYWFWRGISLWVKQIFLYILYCILCIFKTITNLFQFNLEFYRAKTQDTMKVKKNQKSNMIDLDSFQWFIVAIICMFMNFKLSIWLGFIYNLFCFIELDHNFS